MAIGFIGALSHPLYKGGNRLASHGLMEFGPRKCIYPMDGNKGWRK